MSWVEGGITVTRNFLHHAITCHLLSKDREIMSALVATPRRGLSLALSFLIIGTAVLIAAPAALAAPASLPAPVSGVTSQISTGTGAASQPSARKLTASPTPTISGVPQAGRRLTALPGTWQPAPVSLTYRWMVAGVTVFGATASVFTPSSAHVGKRIAVAVTGTKAGYQTVLRTSVSTGLVAPATIAVGAGPRKVVVTANGGWAYVANSQSHTVSVINTATGKVVARVAVGRNPVGLAVSTNQKQIFVSTCADEKVYAINIKSNTIAYSFAAGTCGDLLATPDGKSLYIGNSPTLREITVATIQARRLADPIFTGTAGSQLTLSADQTQVYVSNGDDYSILVVDTATNRLLPKRIDTAYPPVASAPSPDGKTVYASLGRDLVTGASNVVEVIDTVTNRVRASITINAPGDLEVSGDGSRLYVLSGDDNTIVTISTATNRIISRIPVGHAPTSLAVMPDSSKVGITNFGDNTLSVLPIF